MSEREILLSMNAIEKKFGDVQVLKKVDMEVARGEVHALMGENGAGKSTLIKILTGVYPKDGGSITFSGKACEINSRSDAQKLGIGVIYQELSLIPTLSVMQNVMLGKEKSGWGFLKIREMKKKVSDLIRYYDFNLQPDAIVETLSIAQRQTVEILKALSEDSSLIIMDEPTASLSSKESEALFGIINQLREKGVSILYISHRLEEVFRLADRLTVLRDGRKVAVLEKAQINPPDVIKMMIGNSVRQLPPDACIAVKWSQCLKYCLSAEKVHFPILVLHFTEGRFWVLEAWSVRAGPKFCAVYLVRIPMMEGRSFSRERSCHAVFLRQ